jgi:hypothetical protein
MELSILSLFLPEALLTHFSILGVEQLGLVETKQDCFYIKLEEKNELPKGYASELYESKGFYNTKEVQDFPIRGKAVYLLIRRRRWRLKSDKKTEIKSDYSFISEGSKITSELTAFLKGTSRDPRRYGE